MQDVGDGAVESELKRAGRGAGLLASDAITRAIYLGIGAAAITLVFQKLQFSTQSICCGDFDSYYHIRWSRLLWEGLREGHFPPTFQWLPLTTLNPQDYVDHHLLFHILQIPFTWFGDLRLGAKIAATLFASLAVFSCYWLIVRYRIKFTLVWLVALLACSAPFLYRLNMGKAPPIAIIFMVAGIYLLFEKRYVWLAPLMFLFVWTYSLFPTLLAAAIIWTAVIGWSERRFEWRPFVWTFLGVIAGFVVNPYFPKNIRLFFEHVIIKVTMSGFTTSVGQEWYPYESWYFLGSCFVAFAAMLVGYIAFRWEDRQAAARPLFFLAFSTFLMLTSFRSRRFVEYWPPFAILFAAFALQPIFDGVRSHWGRLPEDVLDELSPYLDRHERPRHLEDMRRREMWTTLAAAGVALLLGVPLFLNVRETAKTIAGDAAPDYYQKGMEWIKGNVPPGQVVFNTDWDDFPKLFFYDTTHSYVSGLDPTYLLDKNPDLSKLYENITLGNEKDPAPIIRDRFGARYIFTDREEVHDKLYYNAMDSGWCEKVYDDDDCTILYIRDQKGSPPPEEEEDAGEDTGGQQQPDGGGDEEEQ
ncbi:MAG TPA: hypothetical protein VF708_15125 [Pyrinomonadaceae bacterium]|jgi:hypothetical protein